MLSRGPSGSKRKAAPSSTKLSISSIISPGQPRRSQSPEHRMNIVVLREIMDGEARVALMPESVKKLVALKVSVSVESGAGISAARSDDDYREAGAQISSDRDALLQEADVLV